MTFAGLAHWARRRRRATLVLFGFAGVAGVALLALVIYSAVELARFDRVEARRAALIYAMPQPLAVGVHIKIADLAGTLTRLSYTETRAAPQAPGQFHRASGAWDIHLPLECTVAPAVSRDSGRTRRRRQAHEVVVSRLDDRLGGKRACDR